MGFHAGGRAVNTGQAGSSGLMLIMLRFFGLQRGINKLIRLLEGETESQFNAEQYMMLYT